MVIPHFLYFSQNLKTYHPLSNIFRGFILIYLQGFSGYSEAGIPWLCCEGRFTMKIIIS
jgi:hypothetical protein